MSTDPLNSAVVPEVDVPFTPETNERLAMDFQLAEEGICAELVRVDEERRLPYHCLDHSQKCADLFGRLAADCMAVGTLTEEEARVGYIVTLGHDLILDTAQPEGGIKFTSARRRMTGISIGGNELRTGILMVHVLNPKFMDTGTVFGPSRELLIPEQDSEIALLYTNIWSPERAAQYNGELGKLPAESQIFFMVAGTASAVRSVTANNGYPAFNIYQPNITITSSVPDLLLSTSDLMGEVGTRDPARFFETGCREFREMYYGINGDPRKWSNEQRVFFAEKAIRWIYTQRFFAEAQRINFHSYLGEAVESELIPNHGVVPMEIVTLRNHSEVIGILKKHFTKFEENRDALIGIFGDWVEELLEMMPEEYVNMDMAALEYEASHGGELDMDASLSKLLLERFSDDELLLELYRRMGYPVPDEKN